MSPRAPYRIKHPEAGSDTSYRRAWRRRRAFGVGFVLLAMVFLVSPLLPPIWSEFPIPFVTVLLFVPTGICQVAYYLFRCPRCRKRFAGGFPIRQLVPRECASCGLAAGEEEPQEP
jgi:hypothetical protein